MWGGIKDIRALLRDLAARERNELDNGMVSEDHVSLADQAVYAAREGQRRQLYFNAPRTRFRCLLRQIFARWQ